LIQPPPAFPLVRGTLPSSQSPCFFSVEIRTFSSLIKKSIFRTGTSLFLVDRGRSPFPPFDPLLARKSGSSFSSYFASPVFFTNLDCGMRKYLFPYFVGFQTCIGNSALSLFLFLERKLTIFPCLVSIANFFFPFLIFFPPYMRYPLFFALGWGIDIDFPCDRFSLWFI